MGAQPPSASVPRCGPWSALTVQVAQRAEMITSHLGVGQIKPPARLPIFDPQSFIPRIMTKFDFEVPPQPHSNCFEAYTWFAGT